jgi:hypothetical protein
MPKYDKFLHKVREKDRGAGGTGSIYVYGYDHDTDVTSGANKYKAVVLNSDGKTYTYVDSYAQMPCHAVRPCVMDDLSTRHVNYYLNPSNLHKKALGGASDLTGTDGDVMVEFPVSYYRIDAYTDTNSHKHFVFLMATDKFLNSAPWSGFYVSPGGATLRKQYLGMYAAYKDANNKLRSISGVQPTVSTSLANYLTYAGNNGGSVANDLMYQWLFHLYITEYLTCNTQNLAAGHVYMSGSWQASWVRKTGRADDIPYAGGVLADPTGADADLEGSWNTSITASQKQVACKYMIENPWGSIWQNLSGTQKNQDGTEADITSGGVKFYRYEAGDYPPDSDTKTAFAWKDLDSNVIYTAVAHPAINAATYSDTALETSTGNPVTAFDDDYSQSGYWMTTDTECYSQLCANLDPGPDHNPFPPQGYTPGSIYWVYHEWPKAEGNPSKWDERTMYPLNASGGSASAGLTDYFYNNAQGGPRALFRGGDAIYAANAGLGCVTARTVVGYSTAYFGARLSA